MFDLLIKGWDFLKNKKPMRALCCLEITLVFIFVFCCVYQRVDSLQDFFAPLFRFALPSNIRTTLLIVVFSVFLLITFIDVIFEKLLKLFPTSHQKERRDTTLWAVWRLVIYQILGVCLFASIILLTLDLMADYHQIGKIRNCTSFILVIFTILGTFLYGLYILYANTSSRISKNADIEEMSGYCDDANVPILIGDRVAYHHKIYKVGRVKQTIILLPQILREEQIPLSQALDDGGVEVINTSDKRKR